MKSSKAPFAKNSRTKMESGVLRGVFFLKRERRQDLDLQMMGKNV
jgi:hypothetical protein